MESVIASYEIITDSTSTLQGVKHLTIGFTQLARQGLNANRSEAQFKLGLSKMMPFFHIFSLKRFALQIYHFLL